MKIFGREWRFGSNLALLIQVKEAKHGITTFIDADMTKLGQAHKRQLIEFLVGCIKLLGGEINELRGSKKS